MAVVLVGIDAGRTAHGAELGQVGLAVRGAEAALVAGVALRRAGIERLVEEAVYASLRGAQQVLVGVLVREMLQQRVRLVLRVVVDDGRHSLVRIRLGVVPDGGIVAGGGSRRQPVDIRARVAGDVNLLAQGLQHQVGSLLVILGSRSAAGIEQGTLPQAQFGVEAGVGRYDVVPLTVLTAGQCHGMGGIEPFIPVNLLVGVDAFIAIVHQLQTLVNKVGEAEQLELVAVLNLSNLGDGIIEPDGLTINLGQRLVGPHLGTYCGGHQRIPCLAVDVGMVLVSLHVLQVVVAGNDHLIVAGRIGILVVLQVLVVVVQGDELARRVVGRLNQLAAGLGEQNLLVADSLQLGHDAEEAGVHLGVAGETVVAVKLVIGGRLEEVGAGDQRYAK